MPWSQIPSTVVRLSDADRAIVTEQNVMVVSRLRRNIGKFVVGDEQLCRLGCKDWRFHLTMESGQHSATSTPHTCAPETGCLSPTLEASHGSALLLPVGLGAGDPSPHSLSVDPAIGYQPLAINPSFNTPSAQRSRSVSPLDLASAKSWARSNVATLIRLSVLTSGSNTSHSRCKQWHNLHVGTFTIHPSFGVAPVLEDPPVVQPFYDSNSWLFGPSWEHQMTLAQQQSLQLSQLISSLFGLDIHVQAFARIGEDQESFPVHLPGFDCDTPNTEEIEDVFFRHHSGIPPHTTHPAFNWNVPAWL
ncbi:hypothetical protein BKA70DRAFT_1437351 [Coprinopsis sp. MPI-PUGE-AT-0042]|nr:hypothetical protein BKA70DRAFT_1437351 [Coprinopsis sp. MPI-PUGE-AT-0042]